MNGFLLVLAMVGQQNCGPQGCPVPERAPRSRIENPVTNPKWSNLIVQIRADSGSSVGWGTGTIVSVSDHSSLVVTAAHVIDGPVNNRITVIHPTGTYAARILKVAQGADLAALEIAAVPNVQGIGIAQPGSKVGVMFGFGGSNLLHQHSGKYLSAARRLSDVESDNRFSFASDQGDSGGPVVNEHGELFGILWGGDSSTSVVVSTAKLRRFLFDDEKCFRFFRRGPRQINVTITNPPGSTVIPVPAPAPVDPTPIPAQPPLVVPSPAVVVGPQGPAGPQGPPGPAGPAGPATSVAVTPSTPTPVTPTAPTVVQNPFDPTSIEKRLSALENQAIVMAVKQPNGTLSSPRTFTPQVDPTTGKRAIGVTLDLNPPQVPTAPTPVNP